MKRDKRFMVIDGKEVLYRTRKLYLARTFQNACGRPDAKILKARVVFRRPFPSEA